jgi:hypothetical protein
MWPTSTSRRPPQIVKRRQQVSRLHANDALADQERTHRHLVVPRVAAAPVGRRGTLAPAARVERQHDASASRQRFDRAAFTRIHGFTFRVHVQHRKFARGFAGWQKARAGTVMPSSD